MRITQEEQEQVCQLLAAGASHRTIKEQTGLGLATISRLRQTWKAEKSQLATSKQVRPDFGKMPDRKIDPIDFLRTAEERAAKHTIDADYRKIVIDTNKPIAVMKAADLHFGGLDVDYKALREHVEFLFDAEGFYLQLFGDDLNLMIMHPSTAARHDGWTPEEQIGWLEGFVDKCLAEGKIISMAWGNHSDEFTERSAGFGIVKALMRNRVPYFRGLGYIDLQVGEQVYPMAFAHKVRFNSFMNPLHGNKRMEQMHPAFFGPNRPIAKEYITAHTHNPATATWGCLPEERIYYIKCGTFKTHCLYSQRYFGQGKIGVPTVVYCPDRFEHILCLTPWQAYRYMTGKDWTQ